MNGERKCDMYGILFSHKTEGNLPLVTTRMALEDIALIEKYQTEIDKYYVTSLICESKKSQTHRKG